MLEAYEYSTWDHTASLVACVVGLVKQGVKVSDFHPYRRTEARGENFATESTFQALKSQLPRWKDPNG